MRPEETNKNPAFLEDVYRLVDGKGFKESFDLSVKAINELDIDHLNRIGLRTYAEGKWTVNKILQHLIDWERIWCFRAILFARKEGSIPEAHEQEIMGDNSNADELNIAQLVAELKVVRQSSIMMFESFNEQILNTTCVFFEYEMKLYEIALTITAHQIHHFKIIKERYYPLAD